MTTETVIKFKTPIEVDGQTYSEITLREPRLGELAEADREVGTHNVNRRLISLASGTPDAVIRQMPMSSYQECMRFFGRFNAQETGGG